MLVYKHMLFFNACTTCKRKVHAYKISFAYKQAPSTQINGPQTYVSCIVKYVTSSEFNKVQICD